MDLNKIKELAELLITTGITEIEVQDKNKDGGEHKIRISNCKSPTTIAAPVTMQHSAPPLPPDQLHTTPPAHTVETIRQHTVNSPMVGTVYLSSAPGAKQFVEVGQTVKSGDTLCLIEAMKTFNRIEADKAGIISKRLIENGQPVEYDQPLFIIE